MMNEEEEGEFRAVDGRVPGRRGRETRRRLLHQTAEMLGTNGYRDLSVVEVARRADVSPATFYQYFADVETAVLIIAEHAAEQGARRLAELAKTLLPLTPGDMGPAQALAAEFLSVWSEYRSVLLVVDLASSEGDGRFATLRTQMLGPATDELVTAIQTVRGSTTDDGKTEAMAAAASLISMMAHVASHAPGLNEWGPNRDQLRDAMARIVTSALTA